MVNNTNMMQYITLTEDDIDIDICQILNESTKLAKKMLDNKDAYNIKGNPTVEELTTLMINIELEQRRMSFLSDKMLSYDDEIVEIECMNEEIDMLDIKVSGSSLFYANNILTKNSTGPSMTADLMFGIIRTPELDELNQLILKQLKNRFGDPNYYKRFVVGVDKSRMKLYNTEESAQSGISSDVSDTRSNDKPSVDRYSKVKSVKSDEWSFDE